VAAPAAEPPTPAQVATATESEEADDDEGEEGDQETETPEATVTEIVAAARASDSTPTMFDQAEKRPRSCVRRSRNGRPAHRSLSPTSLDHDTPLDGAAQFE